MPDYDPRQRKDEPRDQQRSRVYKSDGALMKVAKPLPTVKEMQRYVDRLFGMRRMMIAFPDAFGGKWRSRDPERQKHYKTKPISAPIVHDGRCRSRAGGWSRGVTMPVWSRNEAVLLHEIAHSICVRLYGYTVAAHGWEYCAIYLKITLYAMGREAHDTLKAAFKANKVKFTAPRKRAPLSPEQRVANIARLAAYREQRTGT